VSVDKSQTQRLKADDAAVDGSEALRDMARNGQFNLLKEELANGVAVDGPSPWGDTALMSAALSGHSKIVEYLLTQKADIAHTDVDGNTPLMMAAMGGRAEPGNVAAVKVLLAAGASAAAKNKKGKAAAELAKGEGVKSLLDTKVRSLHDAARTGKLSQLKAAIGSGAKVNGKDKDFGRTALMWAAESGHSRVVSFLLEHGADAKLQAEDGFTALHFAAYKGHGSISHALLEAGSDVNAQNYGKESALMYASRYGKGAVVAALLEAGADVTLQDIDGDDAQSVAKGDMVKMLVDKAVADAAAKAPGAGSGKGKDKGKLKVDLRRMLLLKSDDNDNKDAVPARPLPRWPYAASPKLPVGWFGSNVSGLENAAQLKQIRRNGLSIFGWQEGLVNTHWTREAQQLIEQAQAVKAAGIGAPTAIYLDAELAEP